jgi:hypothetical protein
MEAVMPVKVVVIVLLVVVGVRVRLQARSGMWAQTVLQYQTIEQSCMSMTRVRCSGFTMDSAVLGLALLVVVCACSALGFEQYFHAGMHVPLTPAGVEASMRVIQ